MPVTSVLMSFLYSIILKFDPIKMRIESTFPDTSFHEAVKRNFGSIRDSTAHSSSHKTEHNDNCIMKAMILSMYNEKNYTLDFNSWNPPGRM